jgi:hypothetical protein
MEPSDLAAGIERNAHLLPGSVERYCGYGIVGLPFAGGDVLALRRFPSTSCQAAYTSVWHRTQDGRWTLYTDIAGDRGCARYLRQAFDEALVAPIRVEWLSPRRLAVSIDGGRLLIWSICLTGSVRSQWLTALTPALPSWCCELEATRGVLEFIIGRTLRAGRVSLAGATPSGHRFLVRPQAVWQIENSRARLCGRDLGGPAPLAQQAALGGFWIPQRGLFMAGEVEMREADTPLPPP